MRKNVSFARSDSFRHVGSLLERARLLKHCDITEKEAERIFVYWYPLATEEEEEQEEAEDGDTLDSESDPED